MIKVILVKNGNGSSGEQYFQNANKLLVTELFESLILQDRLLYTDHHLLQLLLGERERDRESETKNLRLTKAKKCRTTKKNSTEAKQAQNCNLLTLAHSVTRFGNLLDFGQLFIALWQQLI